MARESATHASVVVASALSRVRPGALPRFGRHALFIRLSDGWGWPIEAETDRIFLQPLWVDDNDVWMLTGIPDLVIQDGIMRVSRASLGAPTVPPN